MSDETQGGGDRPRSRARMQRVGDLLGDTARRLGLEEELQNARAAATWQAIVGERVPGAAGASRLIRIDRSGLVVEADEPIVAQELRLRSNELLAAFRVAPGGSQASGLRVTVRRV
jgi:predicted nucleic acid-binding Zn ribbon protein